MNVNDHNCVMLEGTVFEVKNVSFYDYGVVQYGTLVYDRGHNRIQVMVGPNVKVALSEGAHIKVTGVLHGDHIDILTIK